jgi:hypothetical protein
MNGPRPTVPSATQPAAAGVAQASNQTPKLSSRVRLLGNVASGRGLIRRREAQFFLARGRGVYVGQDQDGHDLIRLIRSHPLNLAAEARADRQLDADIKSYRGGPVILWSGSKSPKKSRRPGEVVS